MPPKASGKVVKKAGAKVTGKKATDAKARVAAPKKDPRFEKRTKNFSVGNDLPPKRDLTRFVRWPRYVWRQRRVRILQNRLKVPPAINQFSKTLDAHTRQELVKLCAKYKPESSKDRKERLKAVAASRAEKRSISKAEREAKRTGKTATVPKATVTIPQRPISLRCGIKCVTRLIEQNRAKLVMIAHDVNPLELVLYLPTLCKKLQVPYCIVKGKALLGQLVGFKTATCVAFEKIRPEDKATLDKLIESVNQNFNDKYDETRKESGGLKIGRKAADKKRIKEKRQEKGLSGKK